MSKLLTSRRLWTFVVGQILTIGTFVFSHYNQDPFVGQLAGMVVAFIEGLTAVLITAFTVDDISSNVTAIKMDSHPDFKPHAIPDQSGKVASLQSVTISTPGIFKYVDPYQAQKQNEDQSGKVAGE